MRRTLFATFLVLVGALGGCKHGIEGQSASLVSSSSIYLRNTFDTDPSTYVGRFVPTGVTDPDESNTLILACSKHITSKFIDGGGVEFSEKVSASTQVAAKLGIPLIADASASHQQSRTAKAEYRLTGKMVAEIANPEAFAACCKAQPDQCTDRYIGEFLQGTGSLLHEATRETKVEASGTNPSSGINGAGGIDNSAEWRRVAEFADPVYFAFKVSPTVFSQGTCPAWANNPPRAEGGVYVVGRSDNVRNEGRARDDALGDANAQAMQAAGLAHGSLGAAPVAVRTESWCVTPTKVRRSTRYAVRVLAFVSNESIAEARKAAEVRAAQIREEQRLAAERAAAEREAAAKAAAEHSSSSPPPGEPPRPTGEPPQLTAPASGDYDRIAAAVQAESFSADKLSALASSARNARLTAAEGRRVLDLFSFSGDKMSALQTLRGTISDPQNWHLLVDGFTSSTDREAARALAP